MYIEDGVTIDAGSTVGPNVSISAGTTVRGSTIRDSVIGAKSTITNSRLSTSLIGDSAVVEGVTGQANVGDHSEVRGEAAR